MVSMITRELVETALASRESAERFARRMAAEAASQEVRLSEADLGALAKLAGRYVRETIRLLESCATAGAQARADDVMKPVVSVAEGFFLKPPYAAEEPRGLFGVICASYACRAALKSMSERTRSLRGFPLLANDPHGEAAMIRRVIGSSVAARLESEVEARLSDPRLRSATVGLHRLVGSLRASGGASDWGVPLEDEMTRFGAQTGFAVA